MTLTRRALLESIAFSSAALSLGAPRFASAAGPELDWDWLTGNWDVLHRRLKKRLAGNDDWDEFAGKSAFWHTLGGLGNIDDNLLYLPAGKYRAISLRTFDPAARKWSIWLAVVGSDRALLVRLVTVTLAPAVLNPRRVM